MGVSLYLPEKFTEKKKAYYKYYVYNINISRTRRLFFLKPTVNKQQSNASFLA
jgi:hypothetical protein